MRDLTLRVFSFLLFPALLLGVDCSADKGNDIFKPSASGGAGGSGGIKTDSGPQGGAGGGGGTIIGLGGTSNDGGPLTDAESCSADEAKASRIPLDVVILLDTSGSMAYTDSTNKTKYKAVQEALTAFLQDPKSADLQVGLQYFPLNKPGVPTECSNKSACGNGGPCTSGVCYESIFPNGATTSVDSELWNGCDKDGDCPDFDCYPIGITSDGTSLCLVDPIYNPTCQALSPNICLNALSCDQNQYAELNVPIQAMSTGAQAIVDSMSSHSPEGSTPTHPSLSGVISAAKKDLDDNPTHSAIILLATDGLPTACEPLDIKSIADVAKGAATSSPSIRTFVIGIFTNDDLSQGDPQKNLDTIAEAGGTTSATIIKASSSDVAAQFLAELEKIRGSALACEYDIPTPAAGKSLNYDYVNVQYTPGGGSPKTLVKVKDAASCGQDGGWYYDIDPAKGKPNKILLCDSTCKTIQADGQAKVNFALGCKSKTPA